MQHPLQLHSILVPAVAIGLSIAIFLGANSLPSARFEPMGPAGFPYIASAILFLLGVLDLAMSIRAAQKGQPPKDRPTPSTRGRVRAFAGAVVTIVALFLMEARFIGFVPASLVLLVGLGGVLSENAKREKLWLVVISCAVSIGTALLLTKILSVVLPGNGGFF